MQLGHQCAVANCGRPYWGKTFCQRHYFRWRRHGDPLAGRRSPGQGLDERLWPYVQCNLITHCWVWTGKLDRNGYGWLTIDDHALGVYRILYELLVGPIPAGLELDHLCRNHACCNPLHLEPVPHRINLLRGASPSAIHSRKTSCPQGHTYSGVNNRGQRICCLCIAAQERQRRQHRAARKGELAIYVN